MKRRLRGEDQRQERALHGGIREGRVSSSVGRVTS